MPESTLDRRKKLDIFERLFVVSLVIYSCHLPLPSSDKSYSLFWDERHRSRGAKAELKQAFGSSRLAETQKVRAR
jgi:hypothetical protein